MLGLKPARQVPALDAPNPSQANADQAQQLEAVAAEQSSVLQLAIELGLDGELALDAGAEGQSNGDKNQESHTAQFSSQLLQAKQRFQQDGAATLRHLAAVQQSRTQAIEKVTD